MSVMEDYWALWERHGGDWTKFFGWIDPAISGFVEERRQENRKVEVLRYRWDAPDRTLVFPSPAGQGVWNQIQLLVLGSPGAYHLRFSCAAWKDAELPGQRSPRMRLWCHNDKKLEDRWKIDLGKIHGSALELEVSGRLEQVFRVVGEWVPKAKMGDWSGEGLVEEKLATIP